MFNIKTFLSVAAATVVLTVGSMAHATGGGGSSAGATATSGATAGAVADLVHHGGDAVGLPGSASIGGAPGVDTDVLWIFGKSRPNGCYKAMMVVQTKRSIGQPYTVNQTNQIISQACGIHMTQPRTVPSDAYVGGGKAAPVAMSTRSSSHDLKPFNVRINGKKYRFSDPANIEAYHNCVAFTVPGGDGTRYKKPGC